MKLNLNKPYDQHKAIDYLTKLIEGGKLIELKEIRKSRTIRQNSYLHVLISLYSVYVGNTLEESKTDLKRLCEFMRYEKNNNVYLKSTAKLNTKELTEFIEWVRNYSSVNGLNLPTSEEYITNRFEIDQEIENNKKYL